jgi:hypothetical protein
MTSYDVIVTGSGAGDRILERLGATVATEVMA